MAWQWCAASEGFGAVTERGQAKAQTGICNQSASRASALLVVQILSVLSDSEIGIPPIRLEFAELPERLPGTRASSEVRFRCDVPFHGKADYGFGQLLLASVPPDRRFPGDSPQSTSGRRRVKSICGTRWHRCHRGDRTSPGRIPRPLGASRGSAMHSHSRTRVSAVFCRVHRAGCWNPSTRKPRP